MCLDFRWFDSTKEFITHPLNFKRLISWERKENDTEDSERLVDISGFF